MATPVKKTPKLQTVSVSYNSSMKLNLEKLGQEYKYEHLVVFDSESRTYDVTGMTEEEVDEFVAATRLEIKARIDNYIDEAREETFGD